MITTGTFGRLRNLGGILRRGSRLVALFSYRYDAHLVPDLIENLRPIVDGYAAFDDRSSTDLFSDEPKRRRALVSAAKEMGARWVLFIDPDERHEVTLAKRIGEFTAAESPVVWGFNYRELYAPDAYRVDGLWGKKKRFTLFPIMENQEFDNAALHGPHHPNGYKRQLTGFNVYHLRMIAPDRRLARRDLYKTLDPGGAFQSIGYDYLGDDEGLRLRRIPKRREFRPEHREDGGLWAPDVRSPS